MFVFSILIPLLFFSDLSAILLFPPSLIKEKLNGIYLQHSMKMYKYVKYYFQRMILFIDELFPNVECFVIFFLFTLNLHQVMEYVMYLLNFIWFKFLIFLNETNKWSSKHPIYISGILFQNCDVISVQNLF